MTVALIDSDIVAYRAAASCKGDDPLEIANLRADGLMHQIIQTTGADHFVPFISGTRNFRYELYPEYKANRTKPPPIHREGVKNFLVTEWLAQVSDGIEADDAIGIKHTELKEAGERPVICSIDKDFKQLSGHFYDFVKDMFFTVGDTEADRFFYKQLLLGDKSDNIPGFDGKARQSPTKLISHFYSLIDETDDPLLMYRHCYDAFIDHGGLEEEDLHLTAKLCFILRREGVFWTPPLLDMEQR